MIMIWPPQGLPSFIYKTPCCVCPQCTAIFGQDFLSSWPAHGTPWSDFSTAETVMNDVSQNCIMIGGGTPAAFAAGYNSGGYNAFNFMNFWSLTFALGLITKENAITVNGQSAMNWTDTGVFELKAGVLTFAGAISNNVSGVTSRIRIDVFSPDGSFLDNILITGSTSSISGGGTIIIPNAGSYRIDLIYVFFAGVPVASRTVTYDVTVQVNEDATVCLPQAIYDSGGGTALLDCA